jgi:hypothetical protein
VIAQLHKKAPSRLHAQKPNGTPKEMAERLRELIESEKVPAPPSLARLISRARYAEQCAIRRRLISCFSAPHGWRRSSWFFQPTTLARGGVRDAARDLAKDLWPDVMDHPYFFRRARRAVAAVCHPYALTDARKAEAMEWATQNGLNVEFPDFPSWHYPGETTTVVFTAKHPITTA